jgi:MFS family permease
MRIVAFVATVLVAAVLSTGGAAFAAVEFSHATNGVGLAASISIAFLVYGPLITGSIAGWWDRRSSSESRRWIGRWLVGVVLADVVAGVVIVLAAVDSGAPVWVPVVILAVAALLLAVARPLGSAFRRIERPAGDPESWRPFSADDVRRAIRTIGIVFVATVVCSTVGFVLLDDLHDSPDGVLRSVLLWVQLSFTVTAVAAIMVSIRFTTGLRETAGRDPGRLRRFGKVVLRGKDVPLDEPEQRGAARFATIAPTVSGFQLAYLGFLYVGVGASMVGILVHGDGADRIYPVVLLSLYVALLAWVVPTTVRRMRRAHAYAVAHADLLRSAAPIAADGWAEGSSA